MGAREATAGDGALLDQWQGPDYRGEFNDFGQPFRAGAWHDLVVYSLLRPPPPRMGRT